MALGRKLWLLALLVLGANLFLSLIWGATGVVFLAGAASRDPVLAERIKQFQLAHQGDSEASTDSDAQSYAEALEPLFAPVDWYAVSLVSSALGFCVLGLFLGRLRLDPRYLGALPVLTMIGGHNPAVLPTLMENQGLPGRHLNFPQQVSVLGVQLVSIYLFGSLAARRQQSRQPSLPETPPDLP